MVSRQLSVLAILCGLICAAGNYPAPAYAQASSTQQQAWQTLSGYMGTQPLAQVPEASVISAFNQAAQTYPDMISQFAQLLAAARPDLLQELTAQVQALAPDGAATIINSMELVSIDPPADLLGLIANIEADTTPAAGPAADTTEQEERNGSAE